MPVHTERGALQYLEKIDATSIGPNAITDVELAPDAVGTSELQDDSVDEDKIVSTALGQGLTGGSGTPLAVNVDGVTIDFTGGGALEVLNDSITTAKITGFDSGTALTNSSGISADDTLASYTADDESGAYTGIDNAQAGTVYATVADLNALRTAYENLRALTEDLVAYNQYLVELLENRELIPS